MHGSMTHKSSSPYERNPEHRHFPADERADHLLACSSASEPRLGTPLSMANREGDAPVPRAPPVVQPALPDCNPYHLMGMSSPDECCYGACGPDTDNITAAEQQLCDLYDKLGGWELMSAAVQKLYYRLFDDPLTSHYFTGKDHTRLMSHMTSLLTSGLTGRLMYPPAKIYAMHADMIENKGLSMAHVDLLLDHLDAVLQELGVSMEDQQEARRCLSSTRHVFKARRPHARRYSAQCESSSSSRRRSRRLSTQPDITGGHCTPTQGLTAPDNCDDHMAQLLHALPGSMLEQLQGPGHMAGTKAPRCASVRRYSCWDEGVFKRTGGAGGQAAATGSRAASAKSSARRASTGSIAWLHLAGALAPAAGCDNSSPMAEGSCLASCPFSGNLLISPC